MHPPKLIILNVDFALKLSNYTSWKVFTCPKWFQKKFHNTTSVQPAYIVDKKTNFRGFSCLSYCMSEKIINVDNIFQTKNSQFSFSLNLPRERRLKGLDTQFKVTHLFKWLWSKKCVIVTWNPQILDMNIYNLSLIRQSFQGYY